MPSWSEIVTDIDSYSNAGMELDKKRKEYFEKIKCICFGQHSGYPTQAESRQG